jgi:hypothetical protein
VQQSAQRYPHIAGDATSHEILVEITFEMRVARYFVMLAAFFVQAYRQTSALSKDIKRSVRHLQQPFLRLDLGESVSKIGDQFHQILGVVSRQAEPVFLVAPRLDPFQDGGASDQKQNTRSPEAHATPALAPGVGFGSAQSLFELWF